MRGESSRFPQALALFAALLGLTFASLSTLDYVKHLDRQVHDIHCSFIPGASPEHGADTVCRVAMYSPFSAILRERYWGGVPISLFAVGAFVFFVAFTLYVVLAGSDPPRRAARFLGVVGVTPLVTSIVMFFISLTK